MKIMMIMMPGKFWRVKQTREKAEVGFVTKFADDFNECLIQYHIFPCPSLLDTIRKKLDALSNNLWIVPRES